MKQSKDELWNRTPESKPEAERGLLGAFLLQPTYFADWVADGGRASDFADPAHAIVAQTMYALFVEGKPAADKALLLPRLRKLENNLGDVASALLADLFLNTPSAANWRHYFGEVREAKHRRVLQATADRMLQASFNCKAPGDVADDVIRVLTEIKNGASLETALPSFRRFTCKDLASAEFETEFLVEWTLVAGQPCIVAGPKKACKTTIIIDLAISLATAGYFLGKFKVTRGCRVLLMTGESGLATVQETARRIAIAAGRQLADIDSLIISDQLPMLGSTDHERALRKMLKEDEIEVLILDPTYLCLNPEGDEGSLFAMGAMLRTISTLCAEMGVTLILVHHCKKGIADPFAPPELENIAWAGFQEFARQWLLLGRRERYEPGTGCHQLWLSVGGSAGHSALWAVDINEGEFDGTTPRHWQVDVLKAADAIADAQQTQAEQRNQKAEQRRNAILQADVEQLTKTIVKYRQGETKTLLRDQSGLRTERFNAALKVLIDDGKAEPVNIIKGNGRGYDGYKPAGEPME